MLAAVAYETSIHLPLPLLSGSGAPMPAVSAVAGDSRSELATLLIRAFLHSHRSVLWDGRHRISYGLVRFHRHRGATIGHAESLGSGGRYLRGRCFTRLPTFPVHAAVQAGGAS